MAKAKIIEEEEAEDSETDKEIDCSKYYCKRGKCRHRHWGHGHGGGGGAVYFFGLVASLIYFFQHLGVATASNIFWAIVNSIIWPGLLVYKALELLKF